LHDQSIVDICTEKLHPGKTYRSLSGAQKLAVQTASSELCLATMFIHQSDRRRFGKLSEELESSLTKGNDDYPDNLVSACHLINECKHCTPRSAAPDSSGVAFAQRSEKGNDNHNKNKDDSWQKKATCHHCGEVGHVRPNCPALKDADDKEPDVDKSDATSKDKKTEKKKKKTSFAQQAAETDNESEPESQFTNFGFCAATSNRINLREMMLLDNQSTVDLFCNRKLVSRVWRTEDSMTVHGNGGALTTQCKAHIKNYGDGWFHSKALTNILSLKNAGNKYHVTHNSLGDGAFIAHKPNGVDVHFVMHADGLHYHDTKNRQFSMPMVSAVKEESE
jgi:hypothetical protein